MAGPDWPVCELAASYAKTWEATEQLIDTLSAAERQDVLAGVAARTYQLA